MKTFSFQERLTRVMEQGNCTVSDLAVWFGRPYHTVRGWMVPRGDRERQEGYEPWGPHRAEIYRRLVNLEKFVSKQQVPFNLSPIKRRAYLERVAREHNGRSISPTRSTA